MGHGDHWEAVEKDYKNFVATMLPLVCKEGELVGTHTFYPTDAGGESKEALVCGFQYPAPESPVSFLALVVSRSERDHMIESAYPVFSEGAASRLIVDEVKPSSNGIEGTVEAYLPQGDMICFFDPFFFLNKERYAVGEGIDVALSALAYGLEKFEFSPSEIDEREKLERLRRQMIEDHLMMDVTTPTTLPLTPERAADYYPRDEAEDSADIEFYIEAAVPLACVGRIFWRMTGVLMRAVDTEMRIDVYASEQVLDGYLPCVGDNVSAVVWVQGRIPPASVTGTPRHQF